MAEPLIKIDDLKIAFGAKKVLDGIDLNVYPGETVAIIGPSGTGKSTILRVLIGLLEATGGKVIIEGQDVTRFTEEQWDEIRKHVGMVFQYSALFDFLNVRENVAFGLRQHTKLPEEEIRKRVDELLEMVEMSDAGEMFPSELSGGMKKRVSLARALAFRPHIVLYDEPTAGLDPIRMMSISRLIRKTQEQMGVTSLLVTHDMQSVRVAADRVAMISKGKIVAVGTVDEIENSDNIAVKNFIHGIETAEDKER